MNQLCLKKGRELFGMKVEMLHQNFSCLWKNITAKHISKSLMLFAAQLKTGSYQLYSNLEQLLLKAVRKENYSSEFDFVTKFYESDLNVHALEMQLQIFATNFTMEGKNTCMKDILKC